MSLEICFWAVGVLHGIITLFISSYSNRMELRKYLVQLPQKLSLQLLRIYPLSSCHKESFMAEWAAVICGWGFAHIATHNDVGFTGSVLHYDPQGFEDVIAPAFLYPPGITSIDSANKLSQNWSSVTFKTMASARCLNTTSKTILRVLIIPMFMFLTPWLTRSLKFWPGSLY